MEERETQEPSKKTRKKSGPNLLIACFILAILLIIIGVVTLHSSTKVKTKNTSASGAVAGKVDITSTGFVPATISIKAGETISWTNQDNAPHEVSADPYPKDNSIPGFVNKKGLLKGNSLTFTFTKAGTYTYHDELHPYALKGVVVVK